MGSEAVGRQRVRVQVEQFGSQRKEGEGGFLRITATGENMSVSSSNEHPGKTYMNTVTTYVIDGLRA